ncbi:MAG: virulence RhuM family protein [Bacteroidales bacterium]|nr:virulence RhuM family protein [Bacteroidales bacterium]
MSTELNQPNNFLLYTSEQGGVKVDVLLKDETIWLTINQMAELFDIDKSGISRHIKNIFETDELERISVVAKFATTATDGKIYQVDYYNIDMIISVGYRVNSIRGTHFRIWATKQLKELIIKGFVLNNEKLKNPDNAFGKDYFDELLEQIRDIRSSEKRFYRKITDIYALAVDYNPNTKETTDFFKIVQNKLLFAASGNTAGEIINSRSNASKDNMGLTSWKGSKVRKADVTISKNYLI